MNTTQKLSHAQRKHARTKTMNKLPTNHAIQSRECIKASYGSPEFFINHSLATRKLAPLATSSDQAGPGLNWTTLRRSNAVVTANIKLMTLLQISHRNRPSAMREPHLFSQFWRPNWTRHVYWLVDRPKCCRPEAEFSLDGTRRNNGRKNTQDTADTATGKHRGINRPVDLKSTATPAVYILLDPEDACWPINGLT